MGGSFWGVSLPWWAAAAYGCATKGVVKVVTVAKRQKPPKRAEFIPGQNYVTIGYSCMYSDSIRTLLISVLVVQGLYSERLGGHYVGLYVVFSVFQYTLVLDCTVCIVCS